MQTLHLQAQERLEFGKKTIKIRKSGFIPAVLYGHGIKNRSISVPVHTFSNIYKQAGENTLIDLTIGKESAQKVIIHDIQHDPLTEKLIHVDFYQVRMDEKITTEIPLKFIGESPAVKEHGAVLIKVRDAIQIECLPNDLIPEIHIDLSVLRTLEDNIRIKDVPLPKTIHVLDDPDESIALVTAQKVEEEPITAPVQETTPAETTEKTPEETIKKEVNE